jgi:GNAT superfamily N-acetyltransferase
MLNILTVRSAKKPEMDWINNCYDEVEFVHSIFENEFIAIAELDGQKAGIGRLVTIDSNHLELGGMYVFQSFRNRGIARAIVDFLLKHHAKAGTIYCIPFVHLVSFYKGFGFVSCTDHQKVPKELLDKYLWCKEKYCHPTALLILEK